ncbi:SMP-30/gluconolactonase/LRE family protein [Devosia sp.]|uniref:SMP-30/gluconolactonase/LRE family protein n=1 Tax=Devosia sp. TaxID=1871048 RepID=UPI0032675C27
MSRTAKLLIDSQCSLGEGPIWHPLRNQLFYFDINNKKLFAAEADGTAVDTWWFDEIVAAAAVIDRDTLAIATETGLKKLDLNTRMITLIVDIEADNADTRTNDSRVDRTGGFWIGTMRKAEDAPGGSVYHYRAGKLAKIITDVSVPNATCFSPDGKIAYFTDSGTKRILKSATDPETGKPVGEWSLFAVSERGYPDGAVTDSEGYLWNARWGGGCVVRHAPDGSIDQIIDVPVSQVSCPALGGPDLKTLFLTTANKNLSAAQLTAERVAGGVFAIDVDVPGLPENLIKL